MSTLKIAKYQLRDVFRNRWVVFYTLFFLLVTDALFRFGGRGDQVVASLTNVVLIVIPLVAIVLGTIYLYNSREYVELLLTQPVRRSSLFTGLFAGLTLPLSVGFVVGVGGPFLYHGVGEAGLASVGMLLLTGVALTLVFVALSFFIALVTEDRIRGLGIALVTWMFLAVLYDGLILMAIHTFAAYPLQQPVIVLSLLNPVDLGRVLLLLNFDVSAMMGVTGAVFQSFFGSTTGQVVSATALMTWLAGPFLLGRRAFLRKNF